MFTWAFPYFPSIRLRGKGLEPDLRRKEEAQKKSKKKKSKKKKLRRRENTQHISQSPPECHTGLKGSAFDAEYSQPL